MFKIPSIKARRLSAFVAGVGLALGLGVLSVGYANAATLCPSHSADSFTGASACELGSHKNESLSQVNSDSMFTFSDWQYDAKDNGVNGVDDGPDSLGLSLTGGTLAGGSDGAATAIHGGSWQIAASAFSTYSHIMMVFKDGDGNPDKYVAFLLNAVSGTYQSPFLNGSILKDISHVTLYVRGNGGGVINPIPLPAGLPLLLSAFGLAALVRRKQRKVA